MEKTETVFDRGAAEEAVEKIMSKLGVGGNVTSSNEPCVIAFWTDDDPDYQAIRRALEAEGFKVWSIFPCKWEVEQYDEDVDGDVIYDERVIAVAFDYPGLDKDDNKPDYSWSDDDEETPEEGAAP